MALIDRLRAIEDFPISHVPAAGEVAVLLGKLAAYIEHNDTLFQVADEGAQDLSDLLGRDDDHHDSAASETQGAAAAPASAAAAPAPTAPAAPQPTPPAVQEAAESSGPAPAAVVEQAADAVQDPDVETQLSDLRAQNAQLAQQVQALIANQNRTQVTVEQDPAGDPVAEASASAADSNATPSTGSAS